MPACLGQGTERMDQVVRSYVPGGKFMGSVLVARGGEVLFDRSYGSADLEWNIPDSPETKFRLGSLTKQFTAACVLLLEERGKLKTSDPVSKLMPDAPAAWREVTIYNLLTHTSGIPNFTSFPEYRKLEPFPMTPEQIVATFRDRPLDFPPGTKMSYSNSGYILLGYLIEKAAGEPYGEFLQKNILTPLGMKDTGLDSNAVILARRAEGYVNKGGQMDHAGYINMTIPYSAGAMYSTTHDLLRWEEALYGGKLLKPESLKKMTTPFLDHYGFGIFVEEKDGRKVYSHGGGIEGFNTYLAYYPADRLAVVVLSNVNGTAPQEIGVKLAAVAHGEKVVLASERREVVVPAAVLDSYVGTYELAPNVEVYIRRAGDGLTTQLSGQPSFPLFAESETRFFLKVVDAQIDFEKNAAGKVTSLVLHQNGRDMTAPRKGGATPEHTAVELSPEALAQYPGSYAMGQGMTLEVTLGNGQLAAQLTGQPSFPIYAEAPDKFFYRVVDAQITFERNAAGAVTGLVLHQGGQRIEAKRQ